MDEDEFTIQVLKTVKDMFKPGGVYSGKQIQLHIDSMIIRMEKGYTPQR